MGGNLCRCGCYLKIEDAVNLAASESRCADQGRRMRLVTYDAGQGPRVGILEGDAILDAGFDGDMIAFIEAGAPVGSQTPVESARLLSPLRPRSMRDFLAFEGHLKNAFRRLGRPIPDEWYEVPAFYRGMPDTVIGRRRSYLTRLTHRSWTTSWSSPP